MEDVFDASWQAGSDGRDPDIESALASLIDVRGVALVTQPAQLRLLLTQACPDAPRHVDALLAAVEAGVAERLRAADDDAALPALLRQCAHALQQKSSLDARWSAWSVRTWAHAFALPTDVRPMPAAPSTHVTPSVPFGHPHDAADRETGRSDARSAAPAPERASPLPSMELEASPIDAPPRFETIDDEPASVPVLGDEMLLDPTRDQAARPAPALVEIAEPDRTPAEETLPAPTRAEETVPSSSLDEARLPPAYDQQLAFPTADAEARATASRPAFAVEPEPTESFVSSTSPTAVPVARRRIARPVVATVAIVVVALVAWLVLDAMGRREATTTTSQQVLPSPLPAVAQAPADAPTPTPSAPVAPPPAVAPPPVAEGPAPALEPPQQASPSITPVVPSSPTAQGALSASPRASASPSTRPRSSRGAPTATPARPSSSTAAHAPAALSSAKADASHSAAEKVRAKERVAARSRKAQAARAEVKTAVAGCTEASCGGVVASARVLEAGSAVRGAIYTVVVRADDHRTLAFTTADRPPVGARVRIVGGRLVRSGG